MINRRAVFGIAFVDKDRAVAKATLDDLKAVRDAGTGDRLVVDDHGVPDIVVVELTAEGFVLDMPYDRVFRAFVKDVADLASETASRQQAKGQEWRKKKRYPHS